MNDNATCNEQTKQNKWEGVWIRTQYKHFKSRRPIVKSTQTWNQSWKWISEIFCKIPKFCKQLVLEKLKEVPISINNTSDCLRMDP